MRAHSSNEPADHPQGADSDGSAGSIGEARRLCLAFVCHRGELELKAALLAASLRLQMGDSCELVAVIPSVRNQRLHPEEATLRLLSRLGVRLAEVDNRLLSFDWVERAGDLMTNKIYCLKISTLAERLAVLDSDILCLRPIADDELLPEPTLQAKPVDLQTERRWPALYRLFGRDVPNERIASTESREFGPPYFNSGVLVADPSIASSFADLWLDSFARISASGLMEDNLHFREQASLAIAIQRAGFECRSLGRSLNYPAHLTPLDSDEIPALAHYHWPAIVRREERLTGLIRSLGDRHPEIGDLIARHPSWGDVLVSPSSAAGSTR